MPVEKRVVCPSNPTWLKAMLAVLPPGLRGKLAPFEECFSTPTSSIQKPGAGRPERRRGEAIRPRLIV